jgi:hypothetical protein
MTIAKVVSTEKAGTGDSPSVDTTGANFLVACVSGLTADRGISDSKENAWIELTPQTGEFSASAALYYVANATVGSGHTFTAVGSTTGIVVVAFSGVKVTSPFDQENGVTEGASPRSTGSVTPSENDELVVAGSGGVGNTYSIDSGFTLDEFITVAGGTNFGVAIAHKIQTTAAAVNPAWSTVSGDINAFIATFKAEPSGATAYTVSGPSSGQVDTDSSNFTFTPDDVSSDTVTPASDGDGDWTPATVVFDGTAAAKTAVYHPNSTTGAVHVLSFTNDGALTDPANKNYTVLVGSGGAGKLIGGSLIQ